MNQSSIKKVVIVGGGSAGWLVAGILAADHQAKSEQGIELTLVASPEVATIGVGEGTWPTMRATLKRIGISESEFLRCCDASFKQGTEFRGWVDGTATDKYYHPFSLPAGYQQDLNLCRSWQQYKDKVSFANAVSIQGYLSDADLAPKLITQPEFEGVANYGYHLDAGKFAQLLQRHCVEQLGVKYVADHIVTVNSQVNDDIRSVTTKSNGEITADLFVDCSGLSSLLLGKHFGIELNSQKQVLFNDSAVVTQLPYADDNSVIASCTRSTAQSAGWIWDIGLQTRRGVGYTYSSAHCSDEMAAQTLQHYLQKTTQAASQQTKSSPLALRQIRFEPGYRKKFWHRNCVAVGLSAGFIEPLEASALVMIELAATKISDELPANRALMDLASERFNRQFSYRWARIIEFLKLHYCLSQRTDSDYWQDNRQTQSIPKALAERLTWWRYHAPINSDFEQQQEIFSAASYQYVLYGMGFETVGRTTQARQDLPAQANQWFAQVNQQAQQLTAQLQTNRALLAKIRQYGLQKI